ncbi:MAG: hypothetical protein ACRBN8_19730 [Nannocystales bacterium]
MKHWTLATAAALLLAACDESPEFSAQPGVEVCEMIVDECAYLCDIDPQDETERVEFACSLSTVASFTECGSSIVQRENLQEKHDWPNGVGYSTHSAAKGVIVGYNYDCQAALGTFPVFCYGCRD